MADPRRAAVILAGGLGTRMGELTRTTPKPLLLVGGRPMITFQLDRLAQVGITDVTLATSYLASAFEPALGDGSAYGVRLSYVREETRLGTGGGLRHAADAVGLTAGDTVVVLNGDLLSGHDLAAQIETFEADRAEAGAEATVHAREVVDVRAYGALAVTAERRITRFEEKPAERRAGLINAGTYVVDPVLLQRIPAASEVSLERETFPAALASDVVLTAYLEDAAFLDVGTPEALEQARRSGGAPQLTRSARLGIVHSHARINQKSTRPLQGNLQQSAHAIDRTEPWSLLRLSKMFPN